MAAVKIDVYTECEVEMWVSEPKIGLVIHKWSYIALLKFRMNPMSRLAKKRQKSKIAASKYFEKIVF